MYLLAIGARPLSHLVGRVAVQHLQLGASSLRALLDHNAVGACSAHARPSARPRWKKKKQKKTNEQTNERTNERTNATQKSTPQHNQKTTAQHNTTKDHTAQHKTTRQDTTRHGTTNARTGMKRESGPARQSGSTLSVSSSRYHRAVPCSWKPYTF